MKLKELIAAVEPLKVKREALLATLGNPLSATDGDADAEDIARRTLDELAALDAEAEALTGGSRKRRTRKPKDETTPRTRKRGLPKVGEAEA